MGNESSKTITFKSSPQMNRSNNIAKTENPKPITSPLNTPTSKYQEVESLKLALSEARKTIEEKNKNIEELQREIHKLKSVLDQTYPKISEQENESLMGSSFRLKRLGVSGESPNKEFKKELIRCPKSIENKKMLRDAIMHNMLLSRLDQSQVNEIIECMHERHTLENCYVIREGEEGQRLYVAQKGEFEVYKDGNLISKMGSGKCFGELALLYNCKRTASVKAINAATLWVLERNIFQTIMMKTSIERQKDLKKFLKSVHLFQNLPERKILKMVELVEQQDYSDGQCIIREGESAESFFIIQTGWVKVTQKLSNDEVEVREMTVGDYFGEKALLGEGKRTASIYAKGETEVLCLYRQGFLELIGDLNEIQTKEYDDEARVHVYSTQTSITSDNSIIMSQIHFEELKRVCTLGIGGFGRVELVVSKIDHTKSYALKSMKKQYIVQTKQQNHAIAEKQILQECKSPFICRLYATFRDSKFIYLLSEVCLGGELWTCLRDKVFFDDTITLFCLACVIEAIDYVHSRGIVYRDLKPENLLIGSNGYIKLCDFGFAKKIGIGNQTWTFCGTPEYVAPEIIVNKGHDFSADYWSIGILTFELLNGSPPFVAQDPLKIYKLTLRGIEATNVFHNRRISLKAAVFIQKLCRFQPIERLGNGVNGINDIRTHKYFQGFDWDGINSLTLKSPFTPRIAHSQDVSNFDKFPNDLDDAPDELSGWDKMF